MTERRTLWRNVAAYQGVDRWNIARWSRDGWAPELEREPDEGRRSQKRRPGPKQRPQYPPLQAANENGMRYRAADMPEQHGDYQRLGIEQIGSWGRFVVLAKCTAGYCNGVAIAKIAPRLWMSERWQIRCAHCNRMLQKLAYQRIAMS